MSTTMNRRTALASLAAVPLAPAAALAVQDVNPDAVILEGARHLAGMA